MINVVIYVTAALGFGAGVGVTLLFSGISDMIKERAHERERRGDGYGDGGGSGSPYR